MDEELKKIYAVADKYEDFFNENNADIVIGRKGPNFFYVYDDKYKHMDIFNTFTTAKELETLIIGAILQDLEVLNYAGTECVFSGFDEFEASNIFNEFEPEFHMAKLSKQLEVVIKEQEHWYEMMNTTYKALRNITKDM